MNNILVLGGKEFNIKINFKKSYDLTKYRNKISTGFDFSEADKETVQEILEFTKKIHEEGASVEEMDLSTLSPKALKLMTTKSSENIFSYEEIFDIVRILTDINSDEEIEELLNAEVLENGFDAITNKLIESVSLVFTNAKDISNQKAINKAELVKVAK